MVGWVRVVEEVRKCGNKSKEQGRKGGARKAGRKEGNKGGRTFPRDGGHNGVMITLLVSEWFHTGDHKIQQNAVCVNVRSVVPVSIDGPFTLPNFRGDVRRRALDVVITGEVPPQLFRGPKICQLRCHRRREEEVFAFNITMSNGLGVQERKRRARLRRNGHHKA